MTMFTQNIILSIAAVVLSLLFSVFMTIAVNKDCKARNLKSKTVYTVLTFFFPFIVGIVYACTRKNAQKASDEPVPNAQKLAKTSVTMFIIAVIAFIAAVGINVYLLVSSVSDLVGSVGDYGQEVLYDMKGNEYAADDNILLYDTDGNAYEFYLDENTYESTYTNQTTGDSYDAYYCYVTTDGYFYYDDDESIQMNEEDFISYLDTDGTKYYAATDVVWNADGEMVSYLGEALE